MTTKQAGEAHPPDSAPRTKRTSVPQFLKAVPLDADLAWFINEAESACGVRSTHGALVAMIETGGVSRGAGVRAVAYTDGIHDVEVEQASGERRMLAKHHRAGTDRARRLRARFMAMAPTADGRPSHQDVLCEAYASRPLPRETEAPLGALAGVALLTKAVGGRGEWLLAMCRKPGQNADALEAIRREAAALVVDAVMAWRATEGDR